MISRWQWLRHLRLSLAVGTLPKKPASETPARPPPPSLVALSQLSPPLPVQSLSGGDQNGGDGGGLSILLSHSLSFPLPPSNRTSTGCIAFGSLGVSLSERALCARRRRRTRSAVVASALRCTQCSDRIIVVDGKVSECLLSSFT